MRHSWKLFYDDDDDATTWWWFWWLWMNIEQKTQQDEEEKERRRLMMRCTLYHEFIIFEWALLMNFPEKSEKFHSQKQKIARSRVKVWLDCETTCCNIENLVKQIDAAKRKNYWNIFRSVENEKYVLIPRSRRVAVGGGDETQVVGWLWKWKSFLSLEHMRQK